MDLKPWIGREIITEARLSVEPARLMAATLDQDTTFQTGDPLPPAWHWLYFHEPVKTSGLGQEGHPKLGRFLPPLPLPRRMWAGGRLTFVHPLHLDDRATRRSTVKTITPKQGRSGQLCFVMIEHEISVDGRPCLTEEQTIVYREAAHPGQPVSTPQPAPAEAHLSARYVPDPVLLFRYSALTFNSHRIHYDLDYCRNIEGYPDLVVHGPLIATLLLDLCHRHYPDDTLIGFEYTARSPLFNPYPFTVNSLRTGNTAQAWAANQNNQLAMEATVEFAAGLKP